MFPTPHLSSSNMDELFIYISNFLWFNIFTISYSYIFILDPLETIIRVSFYLLQHYH